MQQGNCCLQVMCSSGKKLMSNSKISTRLNWNRDALHQVQLPTTLTAPTVWAICTLHHASHNIVATKGGHMQSMINTMSITMGLLHLSHRQLYQIVPHKIPGQLIITHNSITTMTTFSFRTFSSPYYSGCDILIQSYAKIAVKTYLSYLKFLNFDVKDNDNRKFSQLLHICC